MESESEQTLVTDTNAISATEHLVYKSKREELEKTGSVKLGDLTLYDYGRKAVIACFD